MSTNTSVESLILPTSLVSEYLSSPLLDNTTICADDLINELLEGLSGRIIWGIIQIILMLSGNIGNIVTLVVLNRRLMRKGGVNNLLQGLAISDIVAPTLACIPHIIYYYSSTTNDDIISFINLYIMPIATGATFCSNWIVVTITSFRLTIVVKPLYSQIYCSSRNEKKALIIIFFFSILSIVPYYYYRSHINAQYVIKVISGILSILGPWIICVVLWILLIRIFSHKIGLKKSNQFILHSEIVAQRLKSKSKITKMVLIICFFNIICQLPVLILTILSLVNSNPCGYIPAMIFGCLLFLSNLLLIVNHSINIIIYSLTNRKFRYTLKMMCRCCYCYFHNHQSRQQTMMAIMQYDEQRNGPYQQKCDNDICSTTNIRHNPRALISIRLKPMSRQNLCTHRRINL
ncbi:unnamed protein product [Rotaria magnacalcarata]|uniref:G-protein coupled receptors family 1 profile domain-containing protein n=1 Tax=Rotaria magnacalcarata TaxID=392030 RepID=A0A816TB97_9BILA|nr:unnamed protein product [Rotaria magnacalcarata]CAF1602928.1 unnamed protein product [Rotaria magnacalcarata]CAF2095110.1 unnamed protein product [Rotaria magnacalcarata]CAF2115844.1 unnamed protein product [Rotaria magnacalcarata]CAF2134601.1 unnamed protein product [Rotaria magnacalcarata]